jgi:cytochrome d ubiquinol oxidase subunit I
MFGSLVGWLFTEMGRQPWIVFGLMLTQDGVSPSVPGWNVLISLIAFTLTYAALAVVEFGLILKAARKGPEPIPEPGDGESADDDAHRMTTVY